jgi:hypothetical protein
MKSNVNIIYMNFELRGAKQSILLFNFSLRFSDNPRRRREYNIKMDLKEIGLERVHCDLAQDRDHWRALVNTVMNLRGP